jgi:homoserine kinase
MSSREVLVRVPASAANLGPGFDTLGLALALYDEIEVALTGDRLVVEVSGEGAATVALTERHLVVRAMRATFEAFGAELPSGLRLSCRNAIPHGRGLGSSAAAAVGGAVAAAALLGRDVEAERETLLQVAAAMDGHADNAAASLLGGFVVVWKFSVDGPDGNGPDTNRRDRFGVARLEPHAELRPVALVPQERSATAMTRKLLPDQVPLADAAFTASRTALGVCAFTARPELLFLATEDRLHQPYRREAYPASAELMDRLRAGGIPALVSGAGPTVLALPADGKVPDALVGSGFAEGFAEHPLDVDRCGAVVEVR